jgi:hypothetical protein
MVIAEQLRKAVNDAIARGTTRYAIAKGAGIKYTTFVRWLDEDRDIRLSTVSRLADYLNLEFRPIDATLKAKTKVNAPALPAVDWTTARPEKKSKRQR